MYFQTPDTFKKFRCLADRCPDTCCAGWEVVIDPETEQTYQNTRAPIGRRLRDAMTLDADGDCIFINRNSRCPFLNRQNLCEIHIALGEDALSETCRLYPRFYNDYGALTEAGLSLSCPEAARLILSDPVPMRFVVTQTAEPPEPDPDLDPHFLRRMFKARRLGLALLQNRRFTIFERLALLLQFATQLTALLFAADDGAEDALCRQFSDSGQLTQILSDLRTPDSPGGFEPFETFQAVFKLLSKCEHRQPGFTKQLARAQKRMTEPDSLADTAFQSPHAHYYEHLSVYYLFRYFLDCVWSCEPLLQVQHTALACLAAYALSFDRFLQNNRCLTPDEHQTLFCAYSREIEHSIPNQALLSNHLTLDPELSPPALTRLLLSFS